MNLDNLKSLLSDNGCKNIYAKRLSPNDNSKNQVYLSGSFDLLNILPISEIAADSKENNYKAKLNFNWITEDGVITKANNAQFILYPQYPEVRFSGFLKGCKSAPSKLMTSRSTDRILFLSVTSDGRILGYVVDSTYELSHEFNNLSNLSTHGVFSIIEIVDPTNNRNMLLAEMLRIHNLGWINSKMLRASGELAPCLAPNCGGYTLEAELGITPNGYSEPDYIGWEIKQFHARNFNRFGSEVLTLMTPEPTNGYYVDAGVEAFVRKYGYVDKMGREDRLNFGGIHRVGEIHPTTNLKLELIGFDQNTRKIRNSDGRISLVDSSDNEAASWSFAALLKHWNRKHNLACYVPSQNRREPDLQYRYGNNLILGTGTDFILFLEQMSMGHIYYDPGIKLENVSTEPRVKRRSQFRIKSEYLQYIYYTNSVIDITR